MVKCIRVFSKFMGSKLSPSNPNLSGFEDNKIAFEISLFNLIESYDYLMI